MQNSDETQQDMTEAIRIAVRKAFAEVKIEEKRAEKKKTLYNTRRLMESYIDLKKGDLKKAFFEGNDNESMGKAWEK